MDSVYIIAAIVLALIVSTFIIIYGLRNLEVCVAPVNKAKAAGEPIPAPAPPASKLTPDEVKLAAIAKEAHAST
jgi:hypothetical protein